MMVGNFTRAALVFASLWLVTSASPGETRAQDRADAVLQGLLVEADAGLERYLFQAPASPGAIAERVELLIQRLAALRPAPDPQVARRVAETAARAGRAALRARPVLPVPADVALPEGALRFERDLDQAEGLRLPLPAGDWRVLVFAKTPFGREVAVNGRRQPVAPGAGVLVLEGRADDDGFTIAFLAPLDLDRVIAEPAGGPSLLGDVLPIPAQTDAAQTRIDAALARAVPRQVGMAPAGWQFIGCVAIPIETASR
ncbi:MAG: hypothetical protein RIM84_11850 [Alphaproteobacteria bacterium]